MAIDAQTIRELITGFNSMQASLGMLPGISGMGGNAFGGNNTPQPVMPKHPGEISAELAQRAAYQQTVTLENIGRAARITPANAAAQTSAQQLTQEFSDRLQELRSQQMTPYGAQFLAGAGGMQGFGAPGGWGTPSLPSPIYQTPSAFGTFRPRMAPPPPIPMARVLPLIRTPFTPQVPSPLLQTPMQFDYYQSAINEDARWAAIMSGGPLAARGMTGLAGVGMGGAMGSYLGGRLGPMGALAGGIAGMVGGGLMGFGPMGRAAERGTEWLMSPITTTRAFGRQFENMTRNWVVGGDELGQLGQGLTLQSSLNLTGQLNRMVGSGAVGNLNMRDMMRLTGMAGQSGMLDMEQSATQISEAMRKIAKNVQVFMQIAQEPDVQKAMTMMSQMRTMGLNFQETTGALTTARNMARMAGTNVYDLYNTGGMPGAMMAQGVGLSPGLGMTLGMSSAASARMAIAAGSYTPQQLSLAGNMRGLQQTNTETALAGLGLNFPLLATLTRDKNGALTVDREKALAIARGEMSITEQAAAGSSNVSRLGGARAVAEISTQLNELRDTWGRTLGPQGAEAQMMSQVSSVMRMTNLPMGGALQLMGLSPNEARAKELAWSNPEYMRTQRQQTMRSIYEARLEESQRLRGEQALGRMTGAVSDWWNGRGVIGTIGDEISGISRDIAGWWGDRNAGDRARGMGGYYVPASEIYSNPTIDKEVEKYVAQGGSLYAGGGLRSATRDRAIGGSAGLLGLEAAAFAAPMLLGGPLTWGGLAIGAGAVILSDAFAPTSPKNTARARAAQALGGMTGALNQTGIWAAGANLLASQASEEATIAEAMDVDKAAEAFRNAGAMSWDAGTAQLKKLESSFTTVAKGKSYNAFRTAAKSAIKGVVARNAGLFAHSNVKESSIRAALIDAAKASGVPEDKVNQFVNSFMQEQGHIALAKEVMVTAGASEKEVIANTLGVNLGAVFGGMDLADLRKNTEKIVEEDVYEKFGVTGWFESGKRERQAWGTMLSSTSDPDEMLFYQLHALEKGEYFADAAVLRKQMQEALGADAFADKDRSALGKLGNALENKDLVSALATSNKSMQRKRLSYSQMREEITGARGKLLGGKASQQIGAGLTQAMDAGLKGFGSAMNAVLSPEAWVEALGKASAEDMKTWSPELRQMRAELDKGPTAEARTAIGQKLKSYFYARGTSGEVTTGGPSGGKAEGEIKATLQMQEAAYAQLLRASKNINSAAQQISAAATAWSKVINWEAVKNPGATGTVNASGG